MKAGVAVVNITPPVGVWLSGYSSRDKPSDDIEDELYAKALVLDDGQNAIAIVSTDLLWLPLEITNQIRKIANEKTGIAEKSVLICGTHTHFGPKIDRPSDNWPDKPSSDVDKDYVQTLIKKIAGSIYIAYKNMREAEIGVAKGEIPEIIFNRRPKKKDGTVESRMTLPYEVSDTYVIKRTEDGQVRMTFTLPPDWPELTFGPIDPDVYVLRVEDADGEIIASVVNFACHTHSGSTYKDWFYSISADFPAITASVVEQMEGGICLFAAGAAGDMVPIKRGKKQRFQMGKALGGEVLRRLQFVQTSSNATLNSLKKKIELPLKKDLPPERTDILKKSITSEVQILKIGDIYILGLPGEVLVEVGLEIKKRAGVENLFIISLSNDEVGYVCHSEAYDEGGYESTSGTDLARGAGEIIIEEALDLINQIKQKQ